MSLSIGARKLFEWKRSPLQFVVEAIKATPSKQQIDGLKALANTDIKRISIRSGHGTGKDAFASWAILWFLTLHRDSKVVCTAPTARQLSDILWSEISKWSQHSEILKEEFTIQSEKIYHKSNPKRWWCRAVSSSVKATKEDQAETLAGFHGDDILFVVDESSGVPDPVYVPLEGALTQENNRILLIGNMTKSQGYFYDTHFHKEISKSWKKLHWNSEESTNVKDSYPIYMRNKYGAESSIYRIRVLGEPPLVDDESFIPLAWAQTCIGNIISIPEEDNLYLGVDVGSGGGEGTDPSVVLPRIGNKILPWYMSHSVNTVDLVSLITQTTLDLEAVGTAIDNVGIGVGPYQTLQRRHLPGLMGVDVRESASDPKEYHRLRDEMWGQMKEKCRLRQYSFPKEKLPGQQESYGDIIANELATPRMGFHDKTGAIKIESKTQMKSRGIASPNVADALGVSEVMYSISHRVWGKKKNKHSHRHRYKHPHLYNTGNLHSWMVV